MILKIRTEARLSEAVRCQIVDTIGRYLKSSKIANKCLGGQEYGQYDCSPVNKGDSDIKGGGGGSREEIFVA